MVKKKPIKNKNQQYHLRKLHTTSFCTRFYKLKLLLALIMSYSPSHKQIPVLDSCHAKTAREHAKAMPTGVGYR